MRKTMVWIVDDDREFLAELREALVLSGYDAEAFSDAAAAKRRLRETLPDIVLFDLKMDGENGFQLAHELKHLPRTERLPMIAMTGHYTSKEHARLVERCGIDLCLVKPLNLADVTERIALLTGGGHRAKSGHAKSGAGEWKLRSAGVHAKNIGAHIKRGTL